MLRSCEGTNTRFCETFPDIKIAHSFSLPRTKYYYIYIYSLAPSFETILLIEIKKSPYFTTIFDESLDKKLERGQMDILIRFWGEDNKKVDIRYFDSSFLDEATAADIEEALMSGIKELDKNKYSSMYIYYSNLKDEKIIGMLYEKEL